MMSIFPNESSVTVERALHEAFAKLRFGHATDTPDGFAARFLDRFNRFLRRFIVQIVNNNAGSFVRQFQRDSPTDAATGARD